MAGDKKEKKRKEAPVEDVEMADPELPVKYAFLLSSRYAHLSTLLVPEKVQEGQG
jgi:hypothetical protein